MSIETFYVSRELLSEHFTLELVENYYLTRTPILFHNEEEGAEFIVEDIVYRNEEDESSWVGLTLVRLVANCSE